MLLAAVGGFVCARNVYVGLQSGTILVRSAKYRRKEHPMYFWIGIALSAVSAALLAFVLLELAYVLVLPRI
jgi:isoprenylcysteine carboxyl methyltransferase (ICMT) family protein YpbQ